MQHLDPSRASPPADSESFPLPDGTALTIRPIRSEDAGRLKAFVAALSPESRYRRFFGPVKTLSDRDARKLATVDYRTRMALVATGVDEVVVAVCRYSLVAPGRADAAVAVADDYQGRGLGSFLCRRLAVYARDQGVEILTMDVLGTNRPMLRLVDHLGFHTSRKAGRGIVEISIDVCSDTCRT